MSKALVGLAEIGGAIALGAGAFFDPALLAVPGYVQLMGALALSGIATEAGAIASALTSNRGQNITTRQASSFRQIVYGVQRVGGVMIYRSTTGSHKDQFNYVIVLADHVCQAIENLYLDGRQVHWQSGSLANKTRNGYNFGGYCDGNTYTGPGGVEYNFGGNQIFCDAYYGDQTDAYATSGGTIGPGGFSTALYANDPNWGPDSNGRLPWVAGLTYVYLKIEYNPINFPGEPEIRFTLHGKNDIWDPRTSWFGYSTNAALCCADVYTASRYLLNEPVNQAQLIAAANICDEQVSVAATESTEVRYACNYHFDTSLAAGDAITTMLASMGGRVTRVGGEVMLWPAAWIASSAVFDQSVLCGPVNWTANRPLRDLSNRVQGTYIAPTYPYNATSATGSDLYDQNGFYNGTIQNNFPFAFQPTSFPQYAQDAQHGYSTDAYLDADSGVQGTWASGTTYGLGDVIVYNGVIFESLQAANTGHTPVGNEYNQATSTAADAWWEFGAVTLPMELPLQAVCSITQAQRLAKIALLRNRYQGAGTLQMKPVALRLEGVDVMEFTFPALGWTEKVLEIGTIKHRFPRDEKGVQTWMLEVAVNESDASIYAWDSATEELDVYDQPASPPTQTYTPAAPTALTLISLPLTGLDGIVTPRVELTWTAPADNLCTAIVCQYQTQPSGGTAGAWVTFALVSNIVTSAFCMGVVAGQQYGFRAASMRANGAISAWTEIDGYTVSLAVSQLSQLGVGIGSLTAQAFAATTVSGTSIPASASILCAPFTFQLGQLSLSVTPTPMALNGLTQQQLYFVYFVDAGFVGGAITPIATQTQSDYLGKPGYFLIDSIVTPYAGSGTGAGTRYYPSTSHDAGTSSTTGPDSAYDGDLSTYASVNATAQTTGGIGPGGSGTPVHVRRSSGDCVWSGFPSITLSASSTLTVVATIVGAVGTATLTGTIGSTATTMDSATAAAVVTTYTLNVPSGTNLSTVSFEAYLTALDDGSGDLNTAAVQLAEIYIQS